MVSFFIAIILCIFIQDVYVHPIDNILARENNSGHRLNLLPSTLLHTNTRKPSSLKTTFSLLPTEIKPMNNLTFSYEPIKRNYMTQLGQNNRRQPYKFTELLNYKTTSEPTIVIENESDEKEKKLNKSIKRFKQFLQVMGKVENFLHDRTNLAAKMFAAVMEEEDKYRRGYH